MSNLSAASLIANPPLTTKILTTNEIRAAKVLPTDKRTRSHGHGRDEFRLRGPKKLMTIDERDAIYVTRRGSIRGRSITPIPN